MSTKGMALELARPRFIFFLCDLALDLGICTVGLSFPAGVLGALHKVRCEWCTSSEPVMQMSPSLPRVLSSTPVALFSSQLPGLELPVNGE